MKRIGIIGLIGCLIIGSIGCGSPKENSPNEMSETVYDRQEEREKGVFELPAQVTFSEEVSGYSSEWMEYEVCDVETVPYDEERVREILFPESDLDDWEVYEYSEEEVFYNYATGKKNVSVGSTLNYSTENWAWKSIFGPYTTISSDGIQYKGSGEAADLPFCTIEEALGDIRETLQALGYEGAQVQNIHSIDHKSMEEKEAQALEDEAYQREQEAGRRPPEKDSWTDEDDGYLFELRVELNGLPILCSTRVLPDDSTVAGGEAYAGYGSTGIEYLELGVLYRITEKKAEPLLPYGQILNILVERYNNLIVDSPTVVSDVQLAYYPIIENEQRKLLPVWAFKAETGTTSQYIYINAIDGTEL